jgi:hypothetical protein
MLTSSQSARHLQTGNEMNAVLSFTVISLGPFRLWAVF